MAGLLVLGGDGTGSIHNIQRSQSIQAELKKIGIHDNSVGREYLTKHLNDVLNDPSNISKVENSSYIAKELPGQPLVEYTATTRESFLMGSGGAVKLKSVWEENRLITVIIEAGK